MALDKEEPFEAIYCWEIYLFIVHYCIGLHFSMFVIAGRDWAFF
jgi:hypothetical protein